MTSGNRELISVFVGSAGSGKRASERRRRRAHPRNGRQGATRTTLTALYGAPRSVVACRTSAGRPLSGELCRALREAPQPIPPGFSPGVSLLIAKLLQKEEQRRPGAATAKSSAARSSNREDGKSRRSARPGSGRRSGEELASEAPYCSVALPEPCATMLHNPLRIIYRFLLAISLLPAEELGGVVLAPLEAGGGARDRRPAP